MLLEGVTPKRLQKRAAPKNFQNLNPPIDVDLSKYLEKNLEELEAQERSKVKQLCQREVP